MIYLAMAGAKSALHAQQVNAHNMANASTAGFRAELDHYASRPVYGPGHPTRVFGESTSSGVDFRHGRVQRTDRELDITVNGDGWIAVQTPDGSEAYSRRGDLRLDASGLLRDGADNLVLGKSGPLAVPQPESMLIGRDGTVTVRPRGQTANALVVVDRIRLVNPPLEDLEKGADGLFRLRDGRPAAPDAAVTITTGALEASNVNPVEAMIRMIENSRYFELQVQLMHTARSNDESSARLMRMS